ncbi:dTDP-4-dehydrorhamnose reductase [Aurantimonas sp. A2-1-M11]|uniref:dTDP-4-dehydrorhamnose reductase n=1 Tax=Aurantimonas sp. A2-1-M11 TaxID=3113712 RepID=UPI002F930A97
MSLPVVLVTGQCGQVAQSLSEFRSGRVRYVTRGRPELDITDKASVERAIARFEPLLVVNPAAFTAVDKAESEPEQAYAVNDAGAGNVAAAAAAVGLPVIHVSTDYVFAGDKASPYTEADPTGPTGVYGSSKLAGEAAVAQANPRHVILRTAWVFSPHGKNFAKTMLALAKDRGVVSVVADQQGTPTYAPDIAAGIDAVVNAILDAPDGESWRGVFHMVAQGETTWAGLAREVFARSAERGGQTAVVTPIATSEYPTPARRPANSRLSTEMFERVFGYALPTWQDGVRRWMKAMASAD